MRFVEYALWNPFAALKARALNKNKTSDTFTIEKELEMTDISEFEIPSAIIAAALIEKSELKGEALENYAILIQHRLIRQMSFSRERMESEKKGE